MRTSVAGLLTTADAAAEVGKSAETIRRWRRSGWIKPTTLDSLTGEFLWGPREIDTMRLLARMSRADRIGRVRRFWQREPVTSS